MVSAGNGAITAAFAGLERTGEDALDMRSTLEGNGVPDSRGGMSNKRLVGNRSMNMSGPGFVANSVIERRRGRMRMRHSVRKCKEFDAGRRDCRAECNAIDDCFPDS